MTAATLFKVDEAEADGGGDDAINGRKVVKDVGGGNPKAKAGDEYMIKIYGVTHKNFKIWKRGS